MGAGNELIGIRGTQKKKWLKDVIGDSDIKDGKSETEGTKKSKAPGK